MLNRARLAKIAQLRPVIAYARFRGAAQLREHEKRAIDFIRKKFHAARQLADFLVAVLDASAHAHQLQIIDNDGASARALGEALVNDPALRSPAAQALKLMGAKAKPALPQLVQAARDFPDVRLDALLALRNIKPDAKTVLPALTASLRSKDPNVRRVALDHLKELTNLRNLYVQKTNVTVAGAAKLRQALPQVKVSIRDSE